MNNQKQTVRYSVVPKSIQYSYFCQPDEPVSILVCPDKEMLKLSDLEDIDKEDSFEEWINKRRKG